MRLQFSPVPGKNFPIFLNSLIKPKYYTMEILSSSSMAKFCGLLLSLKRSKKEFEMVADEIGNTSLRTALNGLSDESSYYEGELKYYLTSLGATPIMKEVQPDESDLYGYPVYNNTGEGAELLNICTHNERSLVKAYSELLEESMPFQSLKEMMLYQLNALKYTFMKIKMLNTARFTVY